MSSETLCQFPLEQEYAKATGVTPADIARLRAWLRLQPHLPADNITDLDLILAFHCCNCSTEVAKQVLDLNLTLKTHFTALFKDRAFDKKIEAIMTHFLITPLSGRSLEGYTCFYGRILDADPKKFIHVDLCRASTMVLDLLQYTEGTWPGLMMIIDMEGISLSHVAALDMQIVQQFLYLGQEAVFFKLKYIHVINAPSFFDMMLNLVKPFLKKEILDIFRIHVAGSRTLDKFIDTDYLPKEAGGKFKSSIEYRDEILQKVKMGQDFFREENKKRVDESKRPGKPAAISDMFGGVIGSFKKLEVD